MLGACLLGLATLVNPVIAAESLPGEETSTFSTLFTKVTDEDGSIRRYIELGPETKSFVTASDSRLHAIQKVRFDPLSMQLDFSDTTYAESMRTHNVSG